MKRKLWIVPVLAVLLAVFWCGIAAADYSGTCGENVSWTLTDSGTLTVSGSGAMADYSVGSDIPWYAYRDSVTSVVIKSGVTGIGRSAFEGCANLTDVKIGNSVTSIGIYAFYRCSGLTDILIPYNVANIKYRAFSGCAGLKGITILNRNTVIGDKDHDVFDNCAAGFTIYGFTGSTAQDYADDAGHSFTNPRCGDRMTFDMDDDGVMTISGMGSMWMYDSSSDAPWYTVRDDITSVVIEEGVAYLCPSAFSYCYNMTSVKIPNSIHVISHYTFSNTGLTYVQIPAGVTDISYLAFSNCVHLHWVDIVNPDANIGDEDYDVFKGCSGSLVIHGWPGSTAETYAAAAGHGFASLGNLSGSCGSGVTFSFEPVAGRLTVSGSGTMTDYAYTPDVPWADYKELIRSIMIESGVKNIGSLSFIYCDRITRMEIPASVKRIGKEAFYNCGSMTDVIIPYGVETIGSSAFFNCSGLTYVTLPKSLTNIGYMAFGKCAKLEGATILYADAVIGDEDYNVFYDCADGFTLCGWTGSTAEAYAVVAGYAFKTLGSLSGSCGENLSFSFNPATGVLEISGQGRMTDYEVAADVPWYLYRQAVTGFSMQYGVTGIGYHAFEGCSAVTGLTIPDTVTRIGAFALKDCTGLKYVFIPDNVTSIGINAFEHCTGLTAVYLPNSVTGIGYRAFRNCSALDCAIIMNPAAWIGDDDYDVFEGCAYDFYIRGWPGSTAEAYAAGGGHPFSPLDVPEPEIFLPAGLISIEEDAFIGIDARAVVIPKKVTSIYGNPFAESSVEVIYGYAGSAAKTLADDYGYCFVTIDDAWMASHRP